jgi:hypothetical protein
MTWLSGRFGLALSGKACTIQEPGPPSLPKFHSTRQHRAREAPGMNCLPFARRALATTTMIAACLLPGTVLAKPPAKTADGPREVPIGHILPFQDRYLRLAPADRDGFTLAYFLKGTGGRPAPDVTVTHRGRVVAMELASDGRIVNAAEIGRLEGATAMASGSGSPSVEIMPTLALARAMPVAPMRNAVEDFATAKRSAGPVGLVVPSLSTLVFHGVASSEAVLADGRRRVLSAGPDGKGLAFRPRERANRDVVSLAFPTMPTKATFAR